MRNETLDFGFPTRVEIVQPVIVSKYYTMDEVVEMFRVTRKTIYNWIAAGYLPEPMRRGKIVRFSKKVIDSILAEDGA